LAFAAEPFGKLMPLGEFQIVVLFDEYLVKLREYESTIL
jgi:hypothetical protein